MSFGTFINFWVNPPFMILILTPPERVASPHLFLASFSLPVEPEKVFMAVEPVVQRGWSCKWLPHFDDVTGNFSWSRSPLTPPGMLFCVDAVGYVSYPDADDLQRVEASPMEEALHDWRRLTCGGQIKSIPWALFLNTKGLDRYETPLHVSN